MKIAVVGATGLVGSLMLKVLEERGFANEEILVAASEKSIGKKIKFSNRELIVQSVEQVINQQCDYAIFSAGGATSKKYAPLFAEKGTIVIDNSSAWRMQENIPLVVPEINANAIKNEDKIISNPNCSTIQMVLALSLLHKTYQIKRIVVSTYQSVTGTGVKAKLAKKHIHIKFLKTYFHTEATFKKMAIPRRKKSLLMKQEKYSMTIL